MRRKGDDFERRVVKDQLALGRIAFRVRQGGGECVDIVSLERMTGWCRAYFIQAKRGGYVRPAERNALLARARAAAAIPLLARPGDSGIEYGVPAPSQSPRPGGSKSNRHACDNFRKTGIF